MRVISYYQKAHPDEHFRFWENGIGVALPALLGDRVKYIELKDCWPDYLIEDDDYDIAYCQLFCIPRKRPAKFIYTFLSDYISHEAELASWIDRVKPNLIACLQHMPDELVDFGKSRGCIVKFLPWFILRKEEYVEKDIEGMCTGCVDPGVYRRRSEIYRFLLNKQRADIVLSCSDKFGNYPLSNDEYIMYLRRAKYYFSGGIYDHFVPPKYYEACNVGACLVSFEMPKMDKIGFVDGKTYLKLSNLHDIDRILDSQEYLEIGKSAQRMIHEHHTVWRRAEQILEIYHELF